MNQKTKTTWIQKNESFFKARFSICIFIALFFVIALIQYILFGCGFELNGISKTDPDAWKNWALFTLFFVGGVFNIYATLLTIRLENTFFKYQLIATICLVTADIILFLWFDLIKMVILTLLFFVRKIQWHKNSDITENKKTKKFTTSVFLKHIFLVVVIAVSLGTGMYFLNNVINYDDPYPYLDAFVIAMLLYGCCFQISANRETWLFFAMSDLCYATMMLMLGGWSGFMMGIIYLYMDFTTFIIWSKEAVVS